MNYKILGILFFWLITLSVLSNVQAQEVYASPQALKKEIVNIRYNNPEKALELAETMLNYGIENEDEKITCEAYHQLGKINSIMGRNQKALIYFDKGIDIAKKIDYHLYLVELLVVKGNSFYELNRDTESLDNYLEARDIAQKEQFNNYEVIISTNIALLKQRAGKLDEAIEQYKKGLKFAELYPNENQVIQSNILSNITMNLSEAFLSQKLMDSSLHYNQLGLKISLSNKDLESSATFLKLIGIAHHGKQQYDTAIEKLLEALEKAIQIDNHQIQSEILYHIARSYAEKQHNENAIAYYKQTIEIAEGIDFSKSTVYSKACKEIADIYKKIGDKEKSITYYEKYISLNDDSQNQKIKVIERLHENDIEVLETEIDNFSKTTILQKKYITISIVFLIALLVLLAILTVKTKIRNKKNRELVNKLLIEHEKEQKVTSSMKQSSSIKDKKVKEILDKLAQLENRKFYLRKDCNLYNVSHQLKTNTTYLSKIINTYMLKNFNTYINDLRINYAIDKIQNDKVFRSYSIKSMASELGYKSADSFSKYFKTTTNLFPSAFVKSVNQLKKEDI